MRFKAILVVLGKTFELFQQVAQINWLAPKLLPDNLTRKPLISLKLSLYLLADFQVADWPKASSPKSRALFSSSRSA